MHELRANERHHCFKIIHEKKKPFRVFYSLQNKERKKILNKIILRREKITLSKCKRHKLTGRLHTLMSILEPLFLALSRTRGIFFGFTVEQGARSCPRIMTRNVLRLR